MRSKKQSLVAVFVGRFDIIVQTTLLRVNLSLFYSIIMSFVWVL